MWYVRLIATISLCSGLNGCSTQPLVCTAEFASLTATVGNGTGQPLPGLSVTDTVRRTGAVLQVTVGSPSTDLPLDGFATVVIFSDAFLDAVRPTGDDVVVSVAADGHSGGATYRFGTDGCHVRKLAGPDSVVVS
jgi:hypothetical protein